MIQCVYPDCEEEARTYVEFHFDIGFIYGAYCRAHKVVTFNLMTSEISEAEYLSLSVMGE